MYAMKYTRAYRASQKLSPAKLLDYFFRSRKSNINHLKVLWVKFCLQSFNLDGLWWSECVYSLQNLHLCRFLDKSICRAMRCPIFAQWHDLGHAVLLSPFWMRYETFQSTAAHHISVSLCAAATQLHTHTYKLRLWYHVRVRVRMRKRMRVHVLVRVRACACARVYARACACECACGCGCAYAHAFFSLMLSLTGIVTPSTFLLESLLVTTACSYHLLCQVCVCCLVLSNRYWGIVTVFTSEPRDYAPTIENRRRTSSPSPPLDNLGWPDPHPSPWICRWLYQSPRLLLPSRTDPATESNGPSN